MMSKLGSQPTVLPPSLKFVCLTLFLSFSLPSSICLASINPDALVETISLLDQARKNSLEQLTSEQFQLTKNDDEKKEFKAFIGYLGGRINYYCEELKSNSPSTDLTKLPCELDSSETQNIEQASLPAQVSYTSPTEQLSQIDDELQDSLGEFDAMLLKEQETITERQGMQAEKEAGSSPATGYTPGGQGNQPKQAGSSQQQREKQGSGSHGHGGTQKTSRPDSHGKTDMDVDDDIVARQLREAAEKETDPEIKEKLWEEYRKYKEGTR